jgi:post-segregation antitoxin (ccd killing protein)
MMLLILYIPDQKRQNRTPQSKKETLPIPCFMRIHFSHEIWRLPMLGLNLSQTVNTLLADEVKRRYWAKWNEDNQEAISAYNDRVAKHGLPLTQYRSWGQSLGDVPFPPHPRSLIDSTSVMGRVGDAVKP